MGDNLPDDPRFPVSGLRLILEANAVYCQIGRLGCRTKDSEQEEEGKKGEINRQS